MFPNIFETPDTVTFILLLSFPVSSLYFFFNCNQLVLNHSCRVLNVWIKSFVIIILRRRNLCSKGEILRLCFVTCFTNCLPNLACTAVVTFFGMGWDPFLNNIVFLLDIFNDTLSDVPLHASIKIFNRCWFFLTYN